MTAMAAKRIVIDNEKYIQEVAQIACEWRAGRL